MPPFIYRTRVLKPKSKLTLSPVCPAPVNPYCLLTEGTIARLIGKHILPDFNEPPTAIAIPKPVRERLGPTPNSNPCFPPLNPRSIVPLGKNIPCSTPATRTIH